MLNELEQVDGRIEQRGFEVLLEIWVGLFGLRALHVLGHVDEGDDVNGELAEDGTDDVEVEDVVLGALFGEGFYGLKLVS